MIIGLYNLEPNIVNTAMMQVSQYHKEQGDEVKIYNPFEKFDKVYAFSLFDFTDKSYVTKNMVCGGTGFDMKSDLPDDIKVCDYDWSLFSKCDYSIVWFSRGCIRKCGFCKVPEKEGLIHAVNPKNLNPNGKYIKIQDNNFFANKNWKDAINKIKEWGQPVDFASGIDVRILTKEQADVLNSLKHYKQIHIAWDNPKQDLKPKLTEVVQWIKPYKLMCYVLIGYDSTHEEDLYRVETLRELKIDPFVMPFNKNDRYIKRYLKKLNGNNIKITIKKNLDSYL